MVIEILRVSAPELLMMPFSALLLIPVRQAPIGVRAVNI